MNVNRYVYKDLMFNKILPDINNKWRGDKKQAIILQHDGASGHKHVESLIHGEAMDKFGLDIQLKSNLHRALILMCLIVEYLLYAKDGHC